MIILPEEVNLRPVFNVDKVEEFYSDKDGVPCNYVITTQQHRGGPVVDVYYRETPHPEFGNHYFGLCYSAPSTRIFKARNVLICNADWVEELDFFMIKDSKGIYEYSQHVHDYHCCDTGCIDGGREYTKLSGKTAEGLPEVYKMFVDFGIIFRVDVGE